MELKTILAYIVVNYDVRTEVEGVRPRNWAIGPQPLPDSKAKILFRKRRL